MPDLYVMCNSMCFVSSEWHMQGADDADRRSSSLRKPGELPGHWHCLPVPAVSEMQLSSIFLLLDDSI